MLHVEVLHGMHVRNMHSGTHGQIWAASRGPNKDRLLFLNNTKVRVRFKTRHGATKGEYKYRLWPLSRVEPL